MAHVSEGVSMARQAGLPEQFIDIIKRASRHNFGGLFLSKAG